LFLRAPGGTVASFAFDGLNSTSYHSSDLVPGEPVCKYNFRLSINRSQPSVQVTRALKEPVEAAAEGIA
jgi:hypothetical protein